MTIGYILIGQDNDSFFFEDANTPQAPTCPKCGYLLDFENYFNPLFRLKIKTYDLSYTYDGSCIASLRFKEFCDRMGYSGLVFKEFEREPNFFLLQVKNIVQFDSERRKTEFIGYCEDCKSYEEVIGISPAFLKKVNAPLKKGFYRTDLLFGSGNSKHPFIIVDPDTKNVLKKEKLKGLYFESIEQ